MLPVELIAQHQSECLKSGLHVRMVRKQKTIWIVLTPKLHNVMPTRKAADLRAILTDTDIDRIVEMAWEDRTPFEAIEAQFGLTEAEVIALMKSEMRLQNWKKWRARVQGRATKHAALRDEAVTRFRCSLQRQITRNRISKR
jgi:uncharacterized protein (TIGR03643 family)